MPHWKKNQDQIIGRDPNSSVVFHASPRHDKDLPLDELREEKPRTKEDKWQDDEHLVHPPTSKDPKGIVGHLEKDWEEEIKSRKQKEQKEQKEREQQQQQQTPIGREPNSSVVFHALPRHDKDLPLDAMEGKPLTKEDKWQDDEHIVHPPASNDPKGIVGRLQKDLEEEDKKINISKTDLDKRQ